MAFFRFRPLLVFFFIIVSMIVFYSHGRTQTALNAKGEHANEPIILTGSVGTAIDASYLPDSKHVSVYLIMDKSYPYKPEDLIPKLKTFFDGYGLPVIFVKQLNPVEGDWCTLVIYVGGKSYRGDMTNGNLSLPEFKYNHAAIFAKLKDMYAVANKGISN